jgi:microcystin-dependent protein
MSYRTANFNRIFRNVLHSNNTLSGDLSGDNLASIDYVNNNIESIDLTPQKNELITLQNELNILIGKNTRVIGSITPSILLNPPIHYLICNGQSLLVSQYQNLYNIIGYNYGGSGLNFNLPDFRSYYILGGNNNINNLSFSNLFSGNNITGATNNYLKFGSISDFPLLTEAPSHSHLITDNGHSHELPIEYQPFSMIGDSQFIKSANQDGNYNSASNTTGITILNTGGAIQENDKYSGLNGVNITPPWMSINFLICVN